MPALNLRILKVRGDKVADKAHTARKWLSCHQHQVFLTLSSWFFAETVPLLYRPCIRSFRGGSGNADSCTPPGDFLLGNFSTRVPRLVWSVSLRTAHLGGCGVQPGKDLPPRLAAGKSHTPIETPDQVFQLLFSLQAATPGLLTI